ncbi:hypothetical protein [Neomoorella thermoacetica]|uniref:Hydroxyneurosporene synthase (CrtC) n=1 Tax=Neomoorella thermoacetica TaxID=1525 RepID=A0A1J5K580_NEOTH|nr:hypothetical protein [Moorella thermoacetica]OIQ09391.1 hydroxyneurosporene synthase (CrtC) [Moorella thermoacetica]OIQ12816.1 hydroxyneurosporene synthase (CrtC) [Moorella thermoacetica]
MRESTFSFWQDTNFNALPDQPLSAAGNAYQGQAGEEESWFYEAAAEDGTYLNLLLAVYDGEGRARLSLARTGQEVLTRDITAPFTAASTHLDLQIGYTHIRQAGDCFEVQWKEGEMDLDLKYQPLLPGWQPGDGRINYGEKGNKYFIWSVPVPRAEVSGTLKVAGDKKNFKGYGYHDHRRCNFPLAQALSGAYLGRFYANDYTFLWAAFRGNRLYSGQEITAMYLAKDRQQVLSSGNLVVQVYEQENRDGINYPVEIDLQGGSQPPLRVIIKNPTVVATGSISRLGARNLYCRHQGELKIATQPELALAGQGFTEALAVINDQVYHEK